MISLEPQRHWQVFPVIRLEYFRTFQERLCWLRIYHSHGDVGLPRPFLTRGGPASLGIWERWVRPGGRAGGSPAVSLPQALTRLSPSPGTSSFALLLEPGGRRVEVRPVSLPRALTRLSPSPGTSSFALPPTWAACASPTSMLRPRSLSKAPSSSSGPASGGPSSASPTCPFCAPTRNPQ